MDKSPIQAAGAILWRDPSRREVAVIHRHRYDDWTLPKGKLDPGESFEEGALREVMEETAFAARLGPAAGVLHYEVEGRPKEVRFYEMFCESEQTGRSPDPDEVAEVVWLSPENALRRLSYKLERDLLRDRLGQLGTDRS